MRRQDGYVDRLLCDGQWRWREKGGEEDLTVNPREGGAPAVRSSGTHVGAGFGESARARQGSTGRRHVECSFLDVP
jgi:hypothetical protein